MVAQIPETHWSGAGRKLQLDGVFFSNSPALLVRAAARGLGIALVPKLAAEGALERGELAVVLPGVLRSEGRIAVVYPERELIAPPVRAFVDWLLARAPAALAVVDSSRDRPRPQRRR